MSCILPTKNHVRRLALTKGHNGLATCTRREEALGGLTKETERATCGSGPLAETKEAHIERDLSKATLVRQST